jgi:hypothetical protein
VLLAYTSRHIASHHAQIMGLKFIPSVQRDFSKEQSPESDVYASPTPFDETDMEELGCRVKHLNIVERVMGYSCVWLWCGVCELTCACVRMRSLEDQGRGSWRCGATTIAQTGAHCVMRCAHAGV